MYNNQTLNLNYFAKGCTKKKIINDTLERKDTHEAWHITLYTYEGLLYDCLTVYIIIYNITKSNVL